MKSIQNAMLEEISTNALEVSRALKQVVGIKNDLYITLAQLESILKKFEE